VQTTALKTLLDGNSTIMVRQLQRGRQRATQDVLRRIHDETYHIPYDAFPLDLLAAAAQLKPDPRRSHTFAMFCSALVSFAMVELKFLPSDYDFSECRPSDLSSDADKTTPWRSDVVEYGVDTPLEHSV